MIKHNLFIDKPRRYTYAARTAAQKRRKRVVEDLVSIFVYGTLCGIGFIAFGLRDPILGAFAAVAVFGVWWSRNR